MNTAEQLESIPIGGVTSDRVMMVWDRVEPLLARVVKPDTGQTLDSVRCDLLTTNAQLWVVGDFQGIFVTMIENRPAQKVLFVPFLAGEHMKDWIDEMSDLVEAFARYHECEAIEFSGRKGWNKIGENRPEWKAARTVFRRELSYG